MENNHENSRILICENLPYERHILKGILVKANYKNIFESESGSEAVRIYEQNAPDVVLLDIELPHMSGLDTLVQLKTIDKNVCVIMLSTLSQQEQVIEAIQAGAVDFIMKPFKADHVLRAISKNCKCAKGSLIKRKRLLWESS